MPFLNLPLFKEMLTQSHSPMHRANYLIHDYAGCQLDLTLGWFSDQH